MHYNSRAASQNMKITMSAKQQPIAANEAKMGQRYGLKETDVEILKKLYCMPGKVWALKTIFIVLEGKLTLIMDVFHSFNIF